MGCVGGVSTLEGVAETGAGGVLTLGVSSLFPTLSSEPVDVGTTNSLVVSSPYKSVSALDSHDVQKREKFHEPP